MQIVKWGFGAAPLKKRTKTKYTTSLQDVYLFIQGQLQISESEICQAISVVKGMFNRIVKKDQWDWFTVSMYFDYPEIKETCQFVSFLASLRKAIKDQNLKEILLYNQKLLSTNFPIYVNNFINFEKNAKESTDEYIYILSKISEKELLKIGMTSRNVVKRCKEINASTGVVYPFSPCQVFRVKNAKLAEKLVHERLAIYRIRKDREFFSLPFKTAYTEILDCLNNNNLLYYKYKQ